MVSIRLAIPNSQMAELLNNKGLSTCSLEQVTSEVKDEVRYNANNAWIVNLNNGNVNNNNTYNRYYVCGASELSFDIDEWIEAEKECFKNKHNSRNAQRLHIHLGRLWKIAWSVANGEYQPLRSYCFVLSYPVYREIFAAYPSDRIVHHYVAPFISKIAEEVHKRNGGVSHGNRIGHSSFTYALQVRENMLSSGNNAYVAKMDIRGFFMSIPREKAYNALEKYARLYYDGSDIDEKLRLCKILIMYNPTLNCLKVGDEGLWDKVARNKSLFYAKEGCGLPIGNFYSQLIANLYLADMDACLIRYGVKVSRFVDDITIVADSMFEINEARKLAFAKAEELGLQLHTRKYYVQPVHRGVTSCGYTIKGKRVYINNRCISACMRAINESPCLLRGAESILRTTNSYLGFLRHCVERKNEKRIADAVLEKYGEWLYFESTKDGHLVCHIKEIHTARYASIILCNQIINNYNESRKVSRGSLHPHRNRRRHRRISRQGLQASV